VEVGVGAGFPAEIEWGHEVAEMLAAEDHAVEDGVHETLQGGGGEAVLASDGAEFLRVLFRLEAGVAVADGFFAEAFARLEGGDVVGDVLALIQELGIGLDEADELLAAHLLLAGCLLGEAGDEAHDVVVINDGGGKDDELEIELGYGGKGAELGLGVPGLLLGLEALDFLKVVDEGGAGFVALEIRHGFLQFLDDDGGLVHVEGGAVAVVRAVFVFEFLPRADEAVFDVFLPDGRAWDFQR